MIDIAGSKWFRSIHSGQHCKLIKAWWKEQKLRSMPKVDIILKCPCIEPMVQELHAAEKSDMNNNNQQKDALKLGEANSVGKDGAAEAGNDAKPKKEEDPEKTKIRAAGMLIRGTKVTITLLPHDATQIDVSMALEDCETFHQ